MFTKKRKKKKGNVCKYNFLPTVSLMLLLFSIANMFYDCQLSLRTKGRLHYQY